MKKLFCLLACVATLAYAAVSFATPIFNGDPVANFGTGISGLPTSPTGPGYYIWANNTERTSWSVRWTGGDWAQGTQVVNGVTQANVYNTYQWAGSIIFSNNAGLNNPVKVLWDTNDGNLVKFDGLGSDTITFGIAKAGPHWDGFDFTLNGVVGDRLTYNLDSTFFTKLNDGVYLGQNYQSVLNHSNDPIDFRGGNGLNRQFEVAAPVPEPGTMVLLGAGLLGLAIFGKRRMNA